MTKEEIQAFFNALESQDFNTLVGLIHDDSLRQKIMNESDIATAIYDYVQEIVEYIYSELTEETREFYEDLCLAIGEEELILDPVRREQAKKREADNLEKLNFNKSDDEKLEQIQKETMDHQKAEIAKLMVSDEFKLMSLQYIQSGNEKANVVKTMTNPYTIFQAFNFMDDEYAIAEITKVIKNDDIKKQVLLNKIKNIHCQIEIIKTLSRDPSNDEIKLQVIENMDEQSQAEIAKSLSDGPAKIEIIKKINPRYKNEIISSVTDKQCLEEMIQNEEFKEYRSTIISNLDDNRKVELINTIEDLTDPELLFILGSIDKEKIKELFTCPKLSPDIWRQYRRDYASSEFIKENLTDFIRIDGANTQKIEEIEKALDKMHQKNAYVINNIDFRILDEKYMKALGIDKINLISCYPEVQSRVLGLKDTYLDLFCKSIDVYTKKYDTDEWTEFAENILNHLNEYTGLIESIGDVKNLSDELMNDLINVLQNNNWCEINSLEEVKNYRIIREEKCKNIMQLTGSLYINQKKEAVFQKIFGHGNLFAGEIILKFGEDIENIDDCEAKDYVRALKAIQEIGEDEEDILNEIFEECSFAQIDQIAIQKDLKKEFGKKFNEGLYFPKEEDKVEGIENTYEAGTDFKIIMTSIGAFFGTQVENYKEAWNRPAIGSQHFCASYIRNDMIATAPISNTGICYGFSSMKEDALMLSGPVDIHSSKESFVSTSSWNEVFYSPDEQINHTEEYNEMDYKRIQGGQRKQPDYILVFRKNGNIANMEEAKKASKQWENMPIVIVDIDACLESERTKVNQMLNNYKNNPSIELAKSINQKVRNNRQTSQDFCKDIEEEIDIIRNLVSKTEEQLESKKEAEKSGDNGIKTKNLVAISELEAVYSDVSASDRKKVSGQISAIYKKIKEIAKGVSDGSR